MALQLTPEKLRLENDVHLSYFVKRKKGKPPRVANGRLLDISEAGLCMEISLHDSELFMETQGSLYVLNKQIELQIFCRSHPNNISIDGSIRWFKRKQEFNELADDCDICVGVMFSARQQDEMAELVGHLKTVRIHCGECNVSVSSDAVFCYNCGARMVRRRAFLKRAIHSLFSVGSNGDT
jgi:hypothetical protein